MVKLTHPDTENTTKYRHFCLCLLFLQHTCFIWLCFVYLHVIPLIAVCWALRAAVILASKVWFNSLLTALKMHMLRLKAQNINGWLDAVYFSLYRPIPW